MVVDDVLFKHSLCSCQRPIMCLQCGWSNLVFMRVAHCKVLSLFTVAWCFVVSDAYLDLWVWVSSDTSPVIFKIQNNRYGCLLRGGCVCRFWVMFAEVVIHAMMGLAWLRVIFLTYV